MGKNHSSAFACFVLLKYNQAFATYLGMCMIDLPLCSKYIAQVFSNHFVNSFECSKWMPKLLHTWGLDVLCVIAIMLQIWLFWAMNYLFVKKVWFFGCKCLMQRHDANAWCNCLMHMPDANARYKGMMQMHDAKAWCKMQRHDSIASSKVELLLARSEVKWLLIHIRACRYIWTKIGKQFAKYRKGFEYLGKLLQSGKVWKSF